jgi:hypothetical protein
MKNKKGNAAAKGFGDDPAANGRTVHSDLPLSVQRQTFFYQYFDILYFLHVF